jgi:hypothetical protein
MRGTRLEKEVEIYATNLASMLMHLLLLARFIALMSTSFSVLVPCMCVLHHNFYCIFSCYLPPNFPGLG